MTELVKREECAVGSEWTIEQIIAAAKAFESQAWTKESRKAWIAFRDTHFDMLVREVQRLQRALEEQKDAFRLVCNEMKEANRG